MRTKSASGFPHMNNGEHKTMSKGAFVILSSYLGSDDFVLSVYVLGRFHIFRICMHFGARPCIFLTAKNRDFSCFFQRAGKSPHEFVERTEKICSGRKKNGDNALGYRRKNNVGGKNKESHKPYRYKPFHFFTDRCEGSVFRRVLHSVSGTLI